ncbi:uncharacterized protein CTHT_0036960 [Thermochaetoides thermophila DSM 1495]|uniref:Uncharacterized protein n=1 Tax=Chaetomium thermophilum (strain DSM 1495 / CBS 144.50 / IMI 039719) TaxID=759272 RepID=G0S7N5_CHATD|nr:hypothetical protein CTHT_0036960 [Thermochaetoides thermophila DSM 1495]EGS21826.1 hypothetical protein CTHT_0036960 [Thermochaetoides thermophila DSM 1495]
MDPFSTSYPVFLSPALPSELLSFVLNHCTYPSTLIICSDKAHFISSLVEDFKQQQNHTSQQPQQPAFAPPPHHTTAAAPSNPPQRPQYHPTKTLHKYSSAIAHEAQHHRDAYGGSRPALAHKPKYNKPHPLLTNTLHTLAVSRHICTVFIPTVTHLRAFLSVFSLAQPVTSSNRSKLPQPLPPPRRNRDSGTTGTGTLPILVVYDLLGLHRATSEWSAQGLSSTVATLVEAGKREGMRLVVVERKGHGSRGFDPSRPGDDVEMSQDTELPSRLDEIDEMELKALLEERLPVVNSATLRGAIAQNWAAGRTVELGRVLGRWFRFRRWEWKGHRV